MADIDIAFTNPSWIEFLREHPDECLRVTIWAAFGFKNNAERDAVALLHEYNQKQGEKRN